MSARADIHTNFQQYRALGVEHLKARYCVVVEELANLHHELAMVRTQERTVKLQTWVDLVNRGVSQREADRRADLAAIDYTTEFWEVTATIEAMTLERDLLGGMIDGNR